MISIKAKLFPKSKNDTIVIFVWKEKALQKSLPKELKASKTVLSGLIGFKGEKGEKRIIYVDDFSLASKVIFVGLGNRGDYTLMLFRQVVGETFKFVSDLRVPSVSFYINESITKKINYADAVYTIAETAFISLYKFNKYKTKDTKNKRITKEVVLLCNSQFIKKTQPLIKKAGIIAHATNRVRDFVNEPSNEAIPKSIALKLVNEAKSLNVDYKILGIKHLKKEKMGGILAVSRGSNNEPVFLILKYKGHGKKKKRVCLVGKGICYDSGGLSLKPSSSMVGMKYDMAGAAVCAQTVLAAAKLKIPHEIISITPLTENLIGSKSYRPGDIITTSSGMTIEVANTDAEGRMILSDALHYSGRYKPDILVVIATLTGSVKVCLGEEAAAILGNDNTTMSMLQKAGDEVGERLWPLPLWDEYQDYLKSEVADMKNISLKGAGTITAAKFLSNFIPKTSWAHIDIASTAFEEDGKSYRIKGATGFGVRLFLQYLQTLS